MSEQNRTSTERECIQLPAAFAVNDRGLPDAVFKLRKRPYIKAKQEPKYRFYTLYDRIDVLAAAWDLVAANNGAPGVDGVSIETIEHSPEGIEAYLEGYFDSIPHDKLLACLGMRIADRSVPKLIKQWLRAPIMEFPKDRHQPPRKTYPRKGTPQGGVISPLLSNLYLHWMDKRFHAKDGLKNKS